MPNYRKMIDEEVWGFIDGINACYPADTATRGVSEQRGLYNAMCERFRADRPADTVTRDTLIGDVATRTYNGETPVKIVYFHGGGFVVGGIESHDDVCAEIAAKTGLQLISVDYRLSPENGHPSAFNDALAVSEWVLGAGEAVLVGDSAGGTLAAAVSGRLGERIKGQVLIYPALGGNLGQGSYVEHAEAPLLTRDEVEYYMGVRGGEADDPTLNPLAGSFEGLPPTVAFAAECDPLRDDCFQYAEAIRSAGGRALAVNDHGLVHGHLRARHTSKRAGESFAAVNKAISDLSRGVFPSDGVTGESIKR